MIDNLIAPGAYENMPPEIYHADPALGSSGVKLMLECPKLYHWHYLDTTNTERGKRKPSMEFGSAAHTFILEPDEFYRRYEIAPEMTVDKKTGEEKPLTRKHKEWDERKTEAESEGKTLLMYDDLIALERLYNAIQCHDLARNILTGGVFEKSFFSIDQETGVRIKGRPDYIIDDVMVDFKTTGISLGVSTYSKQEYNLSRHVQAYLHKKCAEDAGGHTIKHFLHVVQMQEPPYLVRIFRVPDDWLQLGKSETDYALQIIKECQEKNDYPGYPMEIEDLILPSWAGNALV